MQLDYHCSVVSVSCYGSWLHETDETAVSFCSRINLQRDWRAGLRAGTTIVCLAVQTFTNHQETLVLSDQHAC